MPLAGRRAVFPTRRRNCFLPCRELRRPSARFLFRFRAPAGLVEDRKTRCALLRQRSAALLPGLERLPRAERASLACSLWSRTHTRSSTLPLFVLHLISCITSLILVYS